MITREFPALVVRSGSHPCRIPLKVTLTWDPDVDPLAIQMICSAEGEEDIVWHFSRELLSQGASSYDEVGCGDVKFQYLGESTNQLIVCLRNPHGHAHIAIPQRAVVQFLEETTDEQPIGEEDVDELMNEFLKEVLGS